MDKETPKMQDNTSDAGTEKVNDQSARAVVGSMAERPMQSPVDPKDFAGLEVDTQAQGRNQHSDGFEYSRGMAKTAALALSNRARFFSEKSTEADGLDDESPPPPATSYEAPIPTEGDAMKETVLRRQNEAVKKPRTIGGLARSRCLTLLSVVFIVIIVAAVVGGVVGSRNASLSSPDPPTMAAAVPTTTPTPDPVAVNAGLPKGDVMVASPLVPVAFTQKAMGGQMQQVYWLFYQTVNGNVKQNVKSSEAGNVDWQNAAPIFTDAHSNSGLAAINYVNQSQPQTSLFYTGSDSTLWEKRLYIGPDDIWELGTSHWPVSGNASFTGDGGWNGFRMAAAYSAEFSTGPGARLFYHGGNTSTSWIQELVWLQSNDTWREGARIYGVDATSHFAVTIEPVSRILRLFYSSGQGTVEEQWLNITSPNAVYERGVSIPSLLAKTSSDLAALSTNKSTWLYYSSAPTSSSNITIRELELSLQPESTVSNSSSLVAMPDLLAKNANRTTPSAFAPFGATISTLDGGQLITVTWAEDVVDPKSGYGALRAASRAINATWGDVSYGQADSTVQIPLGDNNANPS